jgi:hypothetical protein
LQKNQTLAEKHLQDIKDIIQLLIDRMITRIEDDVIGEKRELLPDDSSEEGQQKKSSHQLIY